MDNTQAYRLVEMTRRFYADNASSFSDTRRAPWRGWKSVLECVGFPEVIQNRDSEFLLADIGCGNMRFEAMVSEAIAKCANLSFSANAYCVDATFELMDENSVFADAESRLHIDRVCMDIIGGLESSEPLALLPANIECDLVVCFALMHHVPKYAWREQLMCALMNCVSEKGYLAVSFWQFLKDRRIAKKTTLFTERIAKRDGLFLDVAEGDYLMGWQERDGAYRFCHNFSDDEIDKLISDCISKCAGEGIDFKCICSFYADGKSDDLNRYVVFQRI